MLFATGLGKTIEALAGAALRNYCPSRFARKKTLIITPQDGVQQQWLQSLVSGGVEQARISIIGEKKCNRLARVGKNKQKKQTGDFIICTRYKVGASSVFVITFSHPIHSDHTFRNVLDPK